jgi:hypothetical protein
MLIQPVKECVILYVIGLISLELYFIFKKYLCSCVHIVFILHYKIYICIPINITLTLEKTEGEIKKKMKNDLHCITQKTPLTSEGNTVPAQVAGPVVSLLSDTNIICYENCVEGNNQN